MTHVTTEQWMKWYHNLDRDSKLLYNKKRYQRSIFLKENPSEKRERRDTELSKEHKKIYDKIYSSLKGRKNLTLYDHPEALTHHQTFEWFLEEQKKVTNCRYCGAESPDSMDHIVPASKGGKHIRENLQLICKWCNYAKYTRSHEEYEDWLRQIVAYKTDGRELLECD